MSKHLTTRAHWRRINKPFLAVFLLFSLATQMACAQKTQTLEESTNQPGSAEGPEHVYRVRCYESSFYWNTDLKPTKLQSDQGLFAFYKADITINGTALENAYYIYDFSAGKWLTYTPQESYSTNTSDKAGDGKQSFVTLSDTKNENAYFIFSDIKSKGSATGYDMQVVTAAGIPPTTVKWYLNFYKGYDQNLNGQTIGIWKHDGSRDAGSLWTLENPSSGTQLQTSTKVSSDDERPEWVCTIRNGYGAHVNGLAQPAASADDNGHFAFYPVSDVEGAYYIFDCTKGKWLTYEKKESYEACKDFVKLSAEKGEYFLLTWTSKNDLEGYEIQPYTTAGTQQSNPVYLNYYLGANLNTGKTLGLYYHNGAQDLGSIWLFDETGPYAKTIADTDATNSFDYLGDVTVTLTRTLQGGKWNTFCAPFNISASRAATAFGSDCEIYELTSVAEDGKTMVFTKADKMEAGKPYLVKTTEDKVNPAFEATILREGSPTKATAGNYDMVGTFGTQTLTTDGTELFLTADNIFKKPQDNLNDHNKLHGLRAYFRVPSGTNEKALRVRIAGEATLINAIDTDADDINAPIYNIMGQQVGTSLSELPRGMYVRNGKKFVVK